MMIKITKSVLFVSLFLLLTGSALAVGKAQLNDQSNAQKGKIRACQAKEKSIQTRLSHLINLVTNMEEKFDSIAKRVEDYYISKVVPSGKTVTNYESLVTQINTSKTAVQTALTKTQNDADNFNCTGNPKDQLMQFQEDMQSVKKALKDYRTSIKNLIVAVHSVSSKGENQ